MKTLFEKRQSIRNAESSLGLTDLKLNEHTKAVYAFIRHGESYQDEILKHDYFKDVSTSTIKRSVQILLETNLVTVRIDGVDRRKRILFIP